MQKKIRSHFFVHLVESNNLVNRSYGFFYTVIVHNVLTIVNNCCMLSFFSEQISIYLTNNSIIFVSLLIGIRANNFFIKTALIDNQKSNKNIAALG